VGPNLLYGMNAQNMTFGVNAPNVHTGMNAQNLPFGANTQNLPFSLNTPCPNANPLPATNVDPGTQMNAATFASAIGSGLSGSPQRVVHSAMDMLGKPSLPGGHAAHPQGRLSGDALIAQALSQALSGEKRPIPCWNGATTTLRSWLKLLALWEHESQIPQDKRGIKLLQSFPEGSQPRRIADTVPTDILISAQGYSAILSKLLEKYGPFLEATGPQAVDKFLFEGERGRGESFSSFVATKELARQEMESHLGEHVSDRLCGRILLKQANLNELQRELVSLKGPMMRTFDEVANMLRPLDRPEALARPDNAGGRPRGAYFASPENSAYRDVRKELQRRRNERGYTKRDNYNRPFGGKRTFQKGKWNKGGKSKFSRKGKSDDGGFKGSMGDLQNRTRCFNCNEMGHFARDCPLKTSSTTSSSKGFSDKTKRTFVFGAHPSNAPAVFMHYHQPRPSEALVDTAAEDAVIGSNAMNRLRGSLRAMGLRAIPATGVELPGAGGIGGAAVVQSMMDVPIGVAGHNCILRFTVLKDTGEFETPPLLPVSFLETMDTIIDFQKSECVIGGNTVEMLRLPTGHRAIDILQYHPDGWNLPTEMRKNPDLDPFVLPSHTSSATVSMVSVWLQRADDKVFVQALPGGRLPMIVPADCSGLPPKHITRRRTSHVVFDDGSEITIDDDWQTQHAHRELQQPWHGSAMQVLPLVMILALMGPGDRMDLMPGEALFLATNRHHEAVGTDSQTRTPGKPVTNNQRLLILTSLRMEASLDRAITVRVMISMYRRSHFPCSSGYSIKLDNSWSAMASLKDRINKMVHAKDPTVPKEPNPQRAKNAWRRMTLAIFTLIKAATDQLVVDYLVKSRKVEEELGAVSQTTMKKQTTKNVSQQVVRQGIGKPLTRSKAQKNWVHEPDVCPHVQEYLRHRAGRGYFWWTCLQCGSRWERNQLEETTAGSSSSSHLVVEKPLKGSYPEYLPPPRYRTDMNKLVKVTTKESDNVPKSQGSILATEIKNQATAMLEDQFNRDTENANAGPDGTITDKNNGKGNCRSKNRTLTGVLPCRRSKTPTRKSAVDTEIYELNTDSDTLGDMEMVDPAPAKQE
ncbi:unnamed protein product, partial [Effrenium voratum]